MREILFAAGFPNVADVFNKNKGPNEAISDNVESDHESIYGWVTDCMGATSIYDLPVDIAINFRRPFLFFSSPAGLPGAKVPPAARKPFHPEREVISLSTILSRQRLLLNSKAENAYRFWEITSIVSVALGMLTTILVALSSTEFGRGDGRLQRLVRILAIVFPAVGTAAAGVITFYGPQATWAQASRTLASITQLHGQIAIDVWKLPCIKTDGDPNAVKIASALDEWAKRYVDIQTVATAAGASTSSGGAAGASTSSGGGGAAAPSPPPNK